MHMPALIEPLVGLHSQQLFDEASRHRLASLARRERSTFRLHSRAVLGLLGYLACVALLSVLLTQLVAPAAPAATPNATASRMLYEVTIAAIDVENASFSIECRTTTQPTADAVFASSAAEAASIAADLGCILPAD
jgi:hypothetical protein